MSRTELLTELRYDERLRSGEDFDLLVRVSVRYDAGMVVYSGMCTTSGDVMIRFPPTSRRIDRRFEACSKRMPISALRMVCPED